jgi:hypothetical protein
MVVEPKPSASVLASSDAAKKALDDAAGKLGTTLDSTVQSARMRAEGIASLPMLRAAIETDAATLADMVKDRDVLFKAQPDEVMEIFQVRDGKSTSMLRIPDTAAPLQAVSENETRIESAGDKLHLIVGAPVVNQAGGNEGVIGLSQPVDLSVIKQQIAPHTKAAALVGLAKPVMLVGSAPPPSPMTFAIKTSPQTKLGASGLSLIAAVDTPERAAEKAASPTFKYARFAAWGLAGLLLVMFGVSRTRKR